ncbi:hypothetical protein V6N13_074552 [Hibiscus sabdariffa]
MLSLFSLVFLSLLIAFPLCSTAIRSFHGEDSLLSSGVASSSTLVTVNSWYDRFYFCFRCDSTIRIDCELDLRVAAAANIIDSVTPKAATGPIGTLVSTDTMLVVATDSKVDNTLVKDTKLAAATAPTGSNISTTNVTLRAATGPLKGDASDPILLPTSPVDVNINVPMVAVGESHSIEPFVSTMAPTPTSFGGPEGFIDFMANSTENPSEVPYLLDNVGLDDDPTNILPIPREGGIDYELGKSFLATSSMLVMYDDWLFNKRSMHTATIEEEAPLVISRGAKRRSSLPSEAKPKKPRPSPPISKTRAGMSRVKTLRQRLTFNPAEENEDSMLELSRFGSGLGSSSLEEHCVTA